MTNRRTIKLTEQDVIAAVRNYVRDYTDIIIKEEDIKFFTGVRGDYDKGTAEEFVQSVVIEIVDVI